MSEANVLLSCLSVGLLCAFLALADGSPRLPEESDQSASDDNDGIVYGQVIYSPPDGVTSPYDEQNDQPASDDDDGLIYGHMVYNPADRVTSQYEGALDALRGNYSESLPNYNAERKRSVDRVLQLEKEESQAQSLQESMKESSPSSDARGGEVVEELDLEELFEGMEVWERQEDGSLVAYRTVRTRGQLERFLLQRGDGTRIEYETFKGLRLVKEQDYRRKEIYVSLKAVVMRKLLRRLFVRYQKPQVSNTKNS